MKKSTTLALAVISIWSVIASNRPTYAAGDCVREDLEAHRLGRRKIWVYTGPVAQPARIVNRHTPTHTAATPLIQVRVNNVNVYLDPTVNYIRATDNPISQDNHLAKAQRLYQALTAKPARVVRNTHAHGFRHSQMIQPSMIIYRPDGVIGKPKGGQLKRVPIPSVPAPPKKQPRLMAMATID